MPSLRPFRRTPSRPSRPASRVRGAAATLLGAALLAASHARAATVSFTQSSDPAGIVNETTSFPETSTTVSTLAAPLSTAATPARSFIGWTLNGTRAADSYGQALNPASFTIYEPTAAVAHYLPTAQDEDNDGVQDWFEQRYLGHLALSADSDADLDQLSLALEQIRGTSPVLADHFVAGGQSRRRAANLIAYSAPASGNVQLTTVTDPFGLVSGVSQSVPAWTATPLPVMPAATGGYHFSGWLIGGVRQDDSLLAQPTLVTIGANTTATARYTLDTDDTDADRIPDWFELLHHDTLAHAADFDSDGDGLGLLVESARATSPRLVNTYAGDGFSRRRAAKTLGLNLSGYLPYSFISEPSGLVSISGNVAPGTTVSSPDYSTGLVSGYAFTYWTIEGVRQIDPASGGSAGKLSLELSAPLVATAHFLSPTADTDVDGVPDWYELRHYGDLAQAASSDTDGDALGLRDEAARGGSPLLVDAFSGDGVSRRREGGLTIVDLQFFERLRRVLVSGVLGEIFSPDPNTVTGQNFGADATPALGDWDGDGDLDLFVAGATGLFVYENVGTRHTLHFENRSTAFAGLGSAVIAAAPARIALGDWNGDGRADLALGGTDGVLDFFVSNGSFVTPPATPAFTLATDSASAAPALGDLDGDGDKDLLVLLADGTTRLYPNDGSASAFTAASAVADYLGSPVSQGVAIAIGDITADGRADIVASDAEGRLWEFHQAANANTFTLRSKVWAGSGQGFAPRLAITLGDIEGDGDTDALGGTLDGALVGLRDPRVGRPVGLVPVSGAQSIALTWDADRQDRITGYHVYRAGSAAGPFARLTESPLALPAYTDAAVTSGQNYHYYVTGLTDAYLPGNSLPRTVESLPSETASATAGVVGFAVRPARASAGKLVKVRLAIANPFAISGAGLQLKLSYDPALLVPVTQVNAKQETVKASAIARDLVFTDNAVSAAGELVITGSGGALNSGEGTLFVLTFRVAPDAPADATAPLTLTQVTARDTDGHLLAWECPQNGPLTVSGNYSEGDLTGDGVLDKDDQALLSDLLKLNARPPTADELAAGDLNADGALDQDDFVLLKRLLNGRPIE
jgi:hypothetical protein